MRPLKKLPPTIDLLRYIRTPALPQAVQDYLDEKGAGFALVEDSARAMLMLASNEAINGEAH